MNPNMPSSGRVDVREVLATAAKRLRLGVEGQRTADQLDDVSAAVAELIAAATRYLKARQVVSDIKEFGGPEYAYGDEWRAATVELSAAYFTFRNALIRCGGSP